VVLTVDCGGAWSSTDHHQSLQAGRAAMSAFRPTGLVEVSTSQSPESAVMDIWLLKPRVRHVGAADEAEPDERSDATQLPHPFRVSMHLRTPPRSSQGCSRRGWKAQ
jgi:hypothetical protein